MFMKYNIKKPFHISVAGIPEGEFSLSANRLADEFEQKSDNDGTAIFFHGKTGLQVASRKLCYGKSFIQKLSQVEIPY